MEIMAQPRQPAEIDQLVDCEHEFLRLKQKGFHLEAIKYMELSLTLRKRIFGSNSSEVVDAARVLAASYNTIAMNCIQKEDYDQAYEILKKADALTEPDSSLFDEKIRLKLRAVTLNNLGCFYKRKGKFHAALHHVQKALKIELACDSVDNPAGTHLNLCAILSQLGRHSAALEHAQCAIELLKHAFGQRTNSESDVCDSSKEEYSMLAIAYHNMAVEQEFMSDFDGALASYSEAVRIAECEWGHDHVKTMAMDQSMRQAQTHALNKSKKFMLKTSDASNPYSPSEGVRNSECESSLAGARLPSLRSRTFVQAKMRGSPDANNPRLRGFRLPTLRSAATIPNDRNKVSGDRETSRQIVDQTEKLLDNALINECQLTTAASEIRAWACKESEADRLLTSQNCIPAQFKELQDDPHDVTIGTLDENVRAKHGPRTPPKRAQLPLVKASDASLQSIEAPHIRFEATNKPIVDTQPKSSRFDDLSIQLSLSDSLSFKDVQSQFNEELKMRTVLNGKNQQGLEVAVSGGLSLGESSLVLPAPHLFNNFKKIRKTKIGRRIDKQSEEFVSRRLAALEETLAKVMSRENNQKKPDKIFVKCDLRGDMRVIEVQAKIAVTDLYDTVLKEYDLHAPVRNKGSRMPLTVEKALVLKYTDGDGDLITIATQNALDIAIEYARRQTCRGLHVKCIAGSESYNGLHPLGAGFASLESARPVLANALGGLDAESTFYADCNRIPLASSQERHSIQAGMTAPQAEHEPDGLRLHVVQRCVIALQCAIRSHFARNKLRCALTTKIEEGPLDDWQAGSPSSKLATAVDGSAAEVDHTRLGLRANSSDGTSRVGESESSHFASDFALTDVAADMARPRILESETRPELAREINGPADLNISDTSHGCDVGPNGMFSSRSSHASLVDLNRNTGSKSSAVQLATLLVQAMRCHISRRMLKSLAMQRQECLLKGAAEIIRRQYKMHLARKQMQLARSAQAAVWSAAAKLQRKYRCRLARRQVTQLQQVACRRLEAVVTLQRCLRGHHGRRFARDARLAAADHLLLISRYQVEKPVADDASKDARSKRKDSQTGGKPVQSSTGPQMSSHHRVERGKGVASGLANISGETHARLGRDGGEEDKRSGDGSVGRDSAPSTRRRASQSLARDKLVRKDGGCGPVMRMLLERGEGLERNLPIAAVDLKTKKQVLLRVMDDVNKWEREKLLQSTLDVRFVAQLVDSAHVPGETAMHLLVYLRPSQQLSSMLAEPRFVTSIRMEVCKAVVQCVSYLHSRGVVLVHIGPDDIVRYGNEWKIMGLKWARRTGELLGKMDGLEHWTSIPEVVLALQEGRVEEVKASATLDSWGVGSLLYLVLTGEHLLEAGEEARGLLMKTSGKGHVHAYLEVKVDKVEDVMAKYLVENLVCLDPRDRMSLRDALLYAPQMGIVQDSDATAVEVKGT